MSVRERIIARLTEAFAPDSLDVVDESDLHKGHAGHRPGGETHFRVTIASDRFAGMGRVAIHREIYRVLDAEIEDGVHALAIRASAPEQGD